MIRKNPHNTFKFNCDKCQYHTNNKKDYTKHLLTAKHKKITLSPLKIPKGHMCNCGKIYKYLSGLSRHKKQCNYFEKNHIKRNDMANIEELINVNNKLIKDNITLKKDNKEIKQMMIEICKNGLVTNNVNSNNTTNSHNKTFNLQFFLNETCKDAMNISDFVENIKIQLEDLEKVGKLGYVEGISNIIVKNLEDIDVNRRPLHCSDVKRETMYIKDEDKWEKDSEQKEKMKHVVRQISKKNSQMIPEYKAKYAECSLHSDSKIGKDYGNIIVECVGGMDDNMMKKENDIIKQVASKVAIVK